MKLPGNDILIQSLLNEGVEYIFGYPGGAALHIYDAIFNQNEIEGQYMGLILFTPLGWKKFYNLKLTFPPKRQDEIHMTGMLQALLEKKQATIEAVPNFGRWGEVDSETDLNKSNNRVR